MPWKKMMKKTPSETPNMPTAGRLTRRTKRKSNKPEMLSRNIEITGFSASVRLDAVHHKGDQPYIESQPWLELRGTAREPVKGITDIKISMWSRDKAEVGTARPAS